MAKVEVTDYVSELRAEYQQGFQDGYASAWREIQNVIKHAVIEASTQASTKREPETNITLRNAYQLGSWNKTEGWIIEEYPVWEDAVVSWWQPLPEPPEED